MSSAAQIEADGWHRRYAHEASEARRAADWRTRQEREREREERKREEARRKEYLDSLTPEERARFLVAEEREQRRNDTRVLVFVQVVVLFMFCFFVGRPETVGWGRFGIGVLFFALGIWVLVRIGWGIPEATVAESRCNAEAARGVSAQNRWLKCFCKHRCLHNRCTGSILALMGTCMTVGMLVFSPANSARSQVRKSASDEAVVGGAAFLTLVAGLQSGASWGSAVVSDLGKSVRDERGSTAASSVVAV